MNNRAVLDRPTTFTYTSGDKGNGALVVARQISPRFLELNIDRCGSADLLLDREEALALAAALMEFVAGSKP